jgi:cysteine-rich repeat protein
MSQRKKSAQILIITLIVLMLVSITVVVITATVAKNNRQVFNNIEYERSYNLAEDRLIGAADTLATPQFELFNLLTIDGQASVDADNCESMPVNPDKYYCTYLESGNATRTILTIEETNIVDAYDIPADNYFDIVLFDSSSDAGYRGVVDIEWFGEAALELSLIYSDGQGNMRSTSDVVDPTSGSNRVYDNDGSIDSGFTNSELTAIDNSVRVDLNDLDASKFEGNFNSIQLKYLRVRAVNRDVGTVITIRPVNDDDLPNQVRLIESINYSLNNVETAAPVVFAQLPLSPPTPTPLSQASAYHSINQPVCGNGIVEGAEGCDDLNSDNTDGCKDGCRVKITADIRKDGDCVSFSCYDDPRAAELAEKFNVNLYIETINVRFLEGEDARGCIGGSGPVSRVFAIEGNVCGEGRLRASVTCSNVPVNVSRSISGKSKRAYADGASKGSCLAEYDRRGLSGDD